MLPSLIEFKLGIIVFVFEKEKKLIELDCVSGTQDYRHWRGLTIPLNSNVDVVAFMWVHK